jgi:hypothetical protein
MPMVVSVPKLVLMLSSSADSAISHQCEKQEQAGILSELVAKENTVTHAFQSYTARYWCSMCCSRGLNNVFDHLCHMQHK